MQCQAFAQRASAHASGIERAQQGECGFGFGQTDPQFTGDLTQILRQIAGLVEQPDQVPRDEGLARIMAARPQLGFQMLGQSRLTRAAFIDPRAVLAPAATLIRAPVGAGSTGGTVAGVTVTVERSGINIERAVFRCTPFGNQLIGGRAFQLGPACFGQIGQQHLVRSGACIADIEQRICVQRLADERFNFQIRQRQQLDRLLQLRRHHQ